MLILQNPFLIRNVLRENCKYTEKGKRQGHKFKKVCNTLKIKSS